MIAASGDVVNQVRRVYNAFGRLDTEYQEHGGAVNPSTTRNVGYAYTDGSGNQVRLTGITYPSAWRLGYEYAAEIDATLGRVSALAEPSGAHLAEYSYLGARSVVRVGYPQPGIGYDLAHGTGNDPYAGVDRFGRVVDLVWSASSGQTTLDRVKHGYDRASNRLWRENTALPSGVDELYTYDRMNQLVDVQRGVLDSGHTSLTSKSFAQDWLLDATGNWMGFLEDTNGNGTWDISQARLHNPANEILSMSDPQLDLSHDRAGNMTVVPNPQSLIPNPQSLTFDAWNRLVRVSSGEMTIAEYEYDGLFRRIKKRTPSGSSVAAIRDYYYSGQWQVLEEHLTEEGSSSQLDQRYVWGVRYIDDLVLRDRDTTGDGTLDERLYALQDANWNVTAIADSTGVTHERYRYDAYGAPIYLYPDGTVNPSGSAYAWPVLFTGRHLDPDTNLYHYRFRDYHHLLGRFVTRDPIGYRGGVSLYGYVGNNPWNKTDPTGLWSWTRTFGVIRAVGGAFETAAGASLAFAGGVAVASGVGAPLGVAMVAGGVLVAAHGVDTAQAGVRQAATDTHVDSLTSTGLQAAGMSQGTANLVDAGISVAGSLGAGAVSATTKVAAVAGTEEAAGMTTMQVICKIEKGSKALPDSAYKALGGASTSALSKAAQMEQGVVQGTEGINVLKSVQLAPTGLTPFGDAGAGVFGAAGGATSAYDTNTRDQSR